jgi:hypothetical protein
MRATALSMLLVLAIATDSREASAETLVQSNADTRTVVTLTVKETGAQTLLPLPWQVTPLAAGPAKGANFILVFIDRLLSQDAEGKPSAIGATDRALAVVIPAKNPQTGAAGLNVIRVYTPNPRGLPGPYKNSAQASTRLERSMQATGIEPAAVTELWEVRDAAGGLVTLSLQYPRAVPARSKTDAKIYGGPDLDFFRIYRADQGADLIRSVPTGTDRLTHFQLRVRMAELRPLFDGSEQVVSVAALPWYVRQVFLP